MITRIILDWVVMAFSPPVLIDLDDARVIIKKLIGELQRQLIYFPLCMALKPACVLYAFESFMLLLCTRSSIPRLVSYSISVLPEGWIRPLAL